MAKYFYETVTDWGFVTLDGVIKSGLDFADPMINNHSALARRLKIGECSKAVRQRCIRWGIEREGELLFVQCGVHNETIDRRIAHLMRETGAKSVEREFAPSNEY